MITSPPINGQMRVAYVEDDVPHELINVASIINYGAYSRTELHDKLALLRTTVKTHLGGKLAPRTKAERTKSSRQVPVYIPDELLEVFNEFKYPELSFVQRKMYSAALMAWVKINLKTRAVY